MDYQWPAALAVGCGCKFRQSFHVVFFKVFVWVSIASLAWLSVKSWTPILYSTSSPLSSPFKPISPASLTPQFPPITASKVQVSIFFLSLFLWENNNGGSYSFRVQSHNAIQKRQRRTTRFMAERFTFIFLHATSRRFRPFSGVGDTTFWIGLWLLHHYFNIFRFYYSNSCIHRSSIPTLPVDFSAHGCMIITYEWRRN